MKSERDILAAAGNYLHVADRVSVSHLVNRDDITVSGATSSSSDCFACYTERTRIYRQPDV